MQGVTSEVDLEMERRKDRKQYLQSTAEALDLPKEIIHEALSIFKTCRKKLRHDRGVLAAASLYAAVKKSKCEPLTLKKLIDVAQENTQTYFYPSAKDVGRWYRKIIREFDFSPKVCMLKPTIYALDLARKLELSRDTRHTMAEISKLMEENRLQPGKNPLAVAAGICYIANGKKRKKKRKRMKTKMRKSGRAKGFPTT